MFFPQATLVTLVLFGSPSLAWYNHYDQAFVFVCPSQSFLHQIRSIHSDFTEDRVFDFKCRALANAESENCTMSGYVNNFQQPVIYQCPHNGAINGISSYHSDLYEDRRYNFRCCDVYGMCMTECEYTGFVNKYDGHMDFTVKDGYYLRGISSIFSSLNNDRIFDFEICRLRKCNNALSNVTLS